METGPVLICIEVLPVTDLVISIHGVDKHSKCKLRKTIKINNFLAEVVKLPSCIMKTCSDAHDKARELVRLGHDHVCGMYNNTVYAMLDDDKAVIVNYQK